MRMLPTIAEQKTEHSWLLPIMEAAKDWDWEQDEAAEELLDNWIEEQARSLHPESQAAERVVRTTLLYLLEKEAISKAREAHPEWAAYLPEVLSPREAVEMAAMEMGLSEEDKRAAEDLLRRMQDGSLRPSKELISQMAQRSN